MPRLQRQRALAFNAQNGRCHYCGKPMWLVAANELPLPRRMAALLRCTAEHLTARQDGGTHRRSNIVAACWWCNQRRHRRNTSLSSEAFRDLVQRRQARGRWWPAGMASRINQLVGTSEL